MNVKRYKLLGYLQLFIGMGALAGGLPMILSPDGADIGFSTEALSTSPFDNYLIPGILLFTLIGLGNLAASFFSLKLKDPSGFFGIFFGSALIIWILAQFYFLGYGSWLQPFYLILGIIELGFGIAIKNEKQ